MILGCTCGSTATAEPGTNKCRAHSRSIDERGKRSLQCASRTVSLDRKFNDPIWVAQGIRARRQRKRRCCGDAVEPRYRSRYCIPRDAILATTSASRNQVGVLQPCPSSFNYDQTWHRMPKAVLCGRPCAWLQPTRQHPAAPAPQPHASPCSAPLRRPPGSSPPSHPRSST